MSLPTHTRDFDARFPVWLAENGAEVLKPTNPYEVIRYRAMIPGVRKAGHLSLVEKLALRA